MIGSIQTEILLPGKGLNFATSVIAQKKTLILSDQYLFSYLLEFSPTKINRVDLLGFCLRVFFFFKHKKASRNHIHTHTYTLKLPTLLALYCPYTGNAASTVKKLRSHVIRSDPLCIHYRLQGPHTTVCCATSSYHHGQRIKTPRIRQGFHRSIKTA